VIRRSFCVVLLAAGAAVSAARADSARIPPGWKACTNRVLGYSIAHPPRWYTTQLNPRTACIYFEPKPFRIPPNSDFTGTALEVLATQQSYKGLLRSMTDPMYARVRLRRNLVIGGLHATLLETVATGEGLLSRGTVTYAYVLDRKTNPAFIVQTTRARGTDWAARKRIADRAVRSLRFRG
jgi:hypothetical protein